MTEEHDELIREAFFLVKEENICLRRRLEWVEQDLIKLYDEIELLKENKMDKKSDKPKGNTIRLKKKKTISLNT